MFNYPVVHRFVDSGSEESVSDFAYALWATDTKLAVRVLRAVELSEDEVESTQSVEPSFFEGVAPVMSDTMVTIALGDKTFMFIDEKVIDIERPKFAQKFKRCNPILIAHNSNGNIFAPIVLDQSRTRSEISPYLNPSTVHQVLGATPILVVHPSGESVQFTHCSIELYPNNSSDLICSNIEVTHTVNRMASVENGIYNINYTYGVPEIAQAEVSKGDEIEVVVTAWSFPATVEGTDPADFSQAVVNTDVNTTWTLYVGSNGYSTELYRVAIHNGVGVVTIPTDRYNAGDVVEIYQGFRIPPMLEEPTVTII